MRHYPVNSPRASARILALAANARGRLTRAQMEAVRYLRVLEQLELDSQVWHEVLTTLYTDLLPLQQRSWASVFEGDAAQLDKVLDEVEDPRLRYQIFRLSTALAQMEDSLGGTADNPVRQAIQQRWNDIEIPKPETDSVRES